MKKVYIIQDTESMMILGVFGSKKDAEKYCNKQINLFIIKSEVASYENKKINSNTISNYYVILAYLIFMGYLILILKLIFKF
jgi:hypothetical protein